MKELLSLVGGIERRAQEFYEKAAEIFKDDSELAALLSELAKDEAKHSDIVSRILDLPDEELGAPASIKESPESMGRIDDNINVCAGRLEEGGLKTDELVEFMVTIEFSEFNELFLYAVNTFTERFITPEPLANNIRAHKARIERFLASRPEFSRFAESVRRLPDAVARNILVVDDEEAFTEALKSYLDDDGCVECASNGAEALERLAEKTYSAIVTDVDMPVMDGLELYEEAKARFNYTGKSFIFVTGEGTRERLARLNDEGLKCLVKPVSLKEIKKEVLSALGR